MEEHRDDRVLEVRGVEVAADENGCVNYYPGMLADLEEQEAERRERMFEQEFFGIGECGNVEN
jgi:hypothetical protein